MQPTRLELRRFEDGYIISVQGRATMHESKPIQVFVETTFDASSELELLLDLSECNHMDSTFLGLLILLNGTMNKGRETRFSLMAPSPTCRRSLTVTHLHTLLPILDEPPDTDTGEEPCELPVADVDRETMGRHILDCHRALVELGGSKQPSFQRVVERLVSELASKPPG
jgi:anti-anti-sigma factor